jgi:hypothetical protein
MRPEYTPRNVLRVVSTPLLQEYFDLRGLLTDFDWDQFSVESLYDAWMALPAAERNAVSVDFQNAFNLASRQGIKTLIDAGRASGVDLLPAIGTGRASVDKVFQVLLEQPTIFRVATYFNWADNLKRYWFRRHDLPQVAPDLSLEAREELRLAISARYMKDEGRGEFCEIEVYPRGDAHYFMVYLADHPSAVVCFENSNQLKRSLQQRAFDVVFRFEGAAGSLELYAEGTAELRQELAAIFVGCILRQDVVLDATPKPVFALDRLKDPDFRFKIDPADGIKSMRLRSMRLSANGSDGGRITFAAPPRSKEYRLHKLIDRGLNTTNYPLPDLKVEQVAIQAQMLQGNPRPANVTFNLTSSNSCNLKDTPEHNKIRECLKRSEILCG